MSTQEPAGYVARLEEQSRHPNLSSGTPSDRADIVRNILIHQCHATTHGSISDAVLSQVQNPYWEIYRNVVDNFDERAGLNNFAEGALALCNLHRNESQSWKSSLTADKFFSSAHGKRFKTLCQLSSQAENSMKPDEIVPVRTDFKVPYQATDCVPPTLENPAQQLNSSNPNSSNCNLTKPEEPSNSSVNQTFPVRDRNSSYSNTTTNQPTPGFGPNNNNTAPWKVTRPGESTGQFQGAGFSGPDQFDRESRFPNPGHAPQKNQGNGSSGPQNSFSFKKSFGSCREEYDLPPGWDVPELPLYDLPPGWDAPGSTPEYNPGYPRQPTCTNPQRNRLGFYVDQEVPRKPLFSTVAPTDRGPGRPYSHQSHQPQPAHNFYRRTQPVPDEPDPFKADTEEDTYMGPFKTANQQLAVNQEKKYGQNRGPVKPAAYGNVKKSLGTRRGPSSKFVPPVVSKEEPGDSNLLLRKAGPGKVPPGGEEPQDERLKGLEPKMIELIMNEIMDHGAPIAWEDIAGLEFAKKTIKEIVVWPMLRPDIFTGLRGPPKGLLLFGPPGTGKTLIGKCIASQSKSTFFSISASSLTSKWVGEGEKMVKALFSVSRCHQPAVIFIDEIDSLLSQRTDGEHEASRRIKTEFLIQLDGATTDSDERLLVIGATNRPQEIDEAARRRFVKRLYIPLPEKAARQQIILNLLSSQRYQLGEEEVDIICQKTDGYSGSDMANLCREAALGPIRSIDFNEIEMITADQVRPITFEDFDAAVGQVRASVSAKDLDLYIDWNKLFGCGGK